MVTDDECDDEYSDWPGLSFEERVKIQERIIASQSAGERFGVGRGTVNDAIGRLLEARSPVCGKAQISYSFEAGAFTFGRDGETLTDKAINTIVVSASVRAALAQARGRYGVDAKYQSGSEVLAEWRRLGVVR